MAKLCSSMAILPRKRWVGNWLDILSWLISRRVFKYSPVLLEASTYICPSHCCDNTMCFILGKCIFMQTIKYIFETGVSFYYHYCSLYVAHYGVNFSFRYIFMCRNRARRVVVDHRTRYLMLGRWSLTLLITGCTSCCYTCKRGLEATRSAARITKESLVSACFCPHRICVPHCSN